MPLVGKQHIYATNVASVRKTAPVMGKENSIGGINGSVATIGSMMFYFLFGWREYEVKLNIVPNSVLLIILHFDLDKTGHNCQLPYKIEVRSDDEFVEKVEMRNGLPFLCFHPMVI